MAKSCEEKTNVMRILDQKKIPYVSHGYPHEDGVAVDAETVSRLIGKPLAEVFKTLVTRGAKGGYYVFVIPGGSQLDLKKAAKAVNEKNIEMLKVHELLPLTGYVRGGCSPIGMKKLFPTVFDESVLNLSTVTVSAGKIGKQVEVAPSDLIPLIRAKTASLLINQIYP